MRIGGVEAPAGTYWVEPGRLLAGSYVRDVRSLLAAGVTLFVDLTEEGELEAYESPRHLRTSIRDFGVPSTADLRRTLDAINAELAAGGVVYLHCRGGCGRTGTVVGCWLRERGLTGDEALARVEELCGGRCPETPEQRALVRDWDG